MSGEKRAAAASFGTSQLVKRQKSDANVGDGTVARVNGSGSGALVKGVSSSMSSGSDTSMLKRHVKGTMADG